MLQRTSFKMVVSFDILQTLPDDSTHEDVIKHLDGCVLTLERKTVAALTGENNDSHDVKVLVTKLPHIS